MIYNDIITLYHKNGDAYIMEIIPNCYWYGINSTATSGNGVSKNNSYKAFIFNKDVTVRLGDICMKGVGSQITSKNDLRGEEIFIVDSIENNWKGSKIDHTLIYGK